MHTGLYNIPAECAAAVTPHDSNTIQRTRGLWIGTGGDITVTFSSGCTEQFKNVPSGYHLPFSVIKVWNSGTSAADIRALY